MFFNTAIVVAFFATLTFAAPHGQAHGRRSHTHLFARNGAGSQLVSTMAYANNANMNDGTGKGTDSYTYYSGGVSNFPPQSEWISFEAMFEANRPLMAQSCGWNNWGPNNSNNKINLMKRMIQQVAKASMVDHRAILAVIMQESGGCLCVPTTANGVSNPGIMQSHNGVAYSSAAPYTTMRQMIIDGTQGTSFGDGLVQLINQYGDYFSAFRAYNSGSIAADGNLSNGNGATPCYVSDIANRLTGWAFAPSKCPA